MRLWAGLLLGLPVLLWTASAHAGTYLRYRDNAGCDVFTSHAGAIPRQLRDGARIVSEREMRTGKAAAEACAQKRQSEAPTDEEAANLGPTFTTGSLDTRLNSGHYLTENEHRDLKALASPVLQGYILAGLIALMAWISVMVAAFRQGHMGWAMLILFLSPPIVFAYLFVGFGKGRSRFKTLCLLGMLSPLLLFLASTCGLVAFGSAPVGHA